MLGSGYGALGVVQSLGSQGVDVVVFQAHRGVAGHSRWASFCRSPDPGTQGDAWLDRLVEVCRARPTPPVLLAAGDCQAELLARDEDRLREVARFRGHSRGALELSLDKAAFADWATSRGLSAPRSVRADLFRPAEGELAWPLVAKPRHRGLSSLRPSPVDRFTLLQNPAEWARFRELHSDRLHAVVLQSFVPGTTADMYSVGVCAERGRALSLFFGRKVRGYPSAWGETVVGESAELTAGVLEEVEVVVAGLALDGLAEIEFKRDPRSGEFHLIEVNLRAWSWIAATVAEGSDLPLAAWKSASGEPVPRPREAGETSSVRYARVLADFVNVCFRYRTDHPPWASGPIAWWRDLRSPDLVIAEAHLGDWRILWWGLVDAFRLELSTRRRGRASPRF